MILAMVLVATHWRSTALALPSGYFTDNKDYLGESFLKF